MYSRFLHAHLGCDEFLCGGDINAIEARVLQRRGADGICTSAAPALSSCIVVAKELGIDGEKYDGKTMVHLRKSTAD